MLKKDKEMLKSAQPPNVYAQAIKKEQDELVIAYMPALRAMAFRLKERLPSSIDVNDLISIGVEEMIKLSRKYDKEQNDSFWGYVKKRVNGAMFDYLRSLDVLSRNNRKIVKELDLLIDEYYQEHECEPDDEYLAKALNLDIDKAREEITSFNNALSLNVLLSEKDNLVTNFIDPNKITVSFDKAVTSNISNSLNSNSFISTIDISNIDDNDSTLSININYLIDTSTSITTNFNTDIYPSLQNGLNFVFQTEIIYG